MFGIDDAAGDQPYDDRSMTTRSPAVPTTRGASTYVRLSPMPSLTSGRVSCWTIAPESRSTTAMPEGKLGWARADRPARKVDDAVAAFLELDDEPGRCRQRPGQELLREQARGDPLGGLRTGGRHGR